ncbi:hypothetical protein AC1031_011988 [Aphanomyces cochlioides]|nr:hypothetical protein AC1031_011988 [Aphanomyces cochlioides]
MAWMKIPIEFVLSPIEFVFNDVRNTLCRIAVGFGIKGFVHSWLPTALVSPFETFVVVVIWYVFAVDEIINPHARKTDALCVLNLPWLVVLLVILLQVSRRVECQQQQQRQPSARINWRRRKAKKAGGFIQRALEWCKVEMHRLNDAITACTDMTKFVNANRGQCEAIWRDLSQCNYDAVLKKTWNLIVKLFGIDTIHRISDRESHFNKCGTCADAADDIVYECRAK